MHLRIKKLSKTYANGFQALNNINLSIPNGVYGLLGPNGAGKSTLMRTIVTLQDPTSGSIHFDELDVLTKKNEIRQVIGYLPQDFGLYPKISAESLLNHFAVLKGISDLRKRKSLVSTLLDLVNLHDHRKEKLGNFSGGMKQRFGIAQALIADPLLLVLDEPTAGLDPTERHRFYNVLSDLGKDVVIILSTHIVEDITSLCSDLSVIDKGVIQYDGNPQQAIKSIEGKVWEWSGKDGQIIPQNQGCIISSRIINGERKIRFFSKNQPSNGQSVVPSIEDFYFSCLSTSPKLSS